MKIRIAIVEDELIIAHNIARLINELGYEALEAVVNFTSAVEQIEKEKPDLILIDIRLAGSKDGIDLANEINALYNIPFIYLTSNSDQHTVQRAKQTFPAAYIVKPFSKADLYTSVEVALANANFQNKNSINKLITPLRDFIMVKHNNVFSKVFYNDILFINSQHVYIEINTVYDKKYLIRSSMKKYNEILPSIFLKIHRSYIINTIYIDEIMQTEVILKGYSLPVSREFRKDLLKYTKH